MGWLTFLTCTVSADEILVSLEDTTIIDDIDDQCWTGSAIEPTVIIKDKTDTAKTLTKDVDYTVTYKDNINVGTATVIITGKGNYEYATVTKTFSIVSEYEYTISNNEVTIIRYLGSSKEVIIPGTIEGKPVTTIGYSAFQKKGLTSVTIPNSVIAIKELAFCDNKLTSVIIPSSVDTIGYGAFSDQRTSKGNTLDKVVILSNTTIIGDKFYDVFMHSETANFKMYGYAGSSAEEYANATYTCYMFDKEVYTFVALDNWLTIDDIDEQGWTGSAVKPEVLVKDKTDTSKTLTKDKDYTVEYTNNIDAGIAEVTITGKGDYEYATATKDITIVKYTFTEGIEQTITAGDNKVLTFKVDGPLELLHNIYINDEVLDTSNYTTALGSTIITLKKEYVSTLVAGSYTLKATYTNGGSAETTFVLINRPAENKSTENTIKTESSKTIDNSSILLWVLVMMVFGIGVITVVIKRLKKVKK